MLRLIICAALSLGLACVSGCGREDDNVVIVESADPDFGPTPGQVIITAKSTPASRPPASVKSTVAPVAPGDGLVPFLTVVTPLATVSGEYQPLMRIELWTGGAKIVEDRSSADGLGATGLFKRVKPGKYLMKVMSDLLPTVPLVERQVTVDGERSETISVGAVTFKIPEDRDDDVTRAIQVAITAEPSKKLILKSTLQSMEAHGVVGELHKRTALLPFGKYSYTLADLSTDPTIGFTGLPEGTPPVISENTIELSEVHPVTLVNLATLIRTRAFNQPER